MSSAEGYVLPKPGTPKTLGILNIIFGVILILIGFCVVGTTIMTPMMLQFAEQAQKEVQAKAAAQQKAQLKNLDEKATAAKTDEEKKAIEAEKADVIANAPPKPPDMSALTDMYKNKTIMGFNLALYGSGTFMALLLLISGIGLIRLSSWGRKMAIGLAAIQIVRLGLLTAVSILVVQPEQVIVTNKMLTQLEADAKAQGGAANPAAQSLQVSKMMAGMGSLFAVGYFVFGSIYPVVSLILLSQAGSKAACQSRKSPETPDFLA